MAWRWLACGTVEVLWKPKFALILAFSSFVWLGLVSFTFLLTIQHTDYLWASVRAVGWSVKHNNTMVSTPVTSSFGSVDRCQVLEKEISIHKACQPMGAQSDPDQKLLVDGCVDLRLYETECINIQCIHSSDVDALCSIKSWVNTAIYQDVF